MVRMAYLSRSAQPRRARYSLYPMPAVQTISSMSLTIFFPLHAPRRMEGEGASHNNLSSVISVTGMRGGVRYYYDIFVFSINALLYSKPLIQLTRK